MSGPVTAADALAAIEAAHAGGPPVAVVTVVAGAVPPATRMLIHLPDVADLPHVAAGPAFEELPTAENIPHAPHPPALQRDAGVRVTRPYQVRGSFGDAALDARAVELAVAVLARGGVALETVAGTRGEATLFVEAHRARERLVVVGAGHIAVPLAALGVELGFDVVVLDDREAFAAAERFHAQVDVRRARFDDDPFAGVAIDAHTYVALVTRGHRWDFDCLRRLLARAVRPRYIGMIGSRRRVRAALSALLDAGVPRSELAAVHAPIGVDVGAETPAEIAVSIAAELVAVRRGARGPSLAERERVLERLLTEATQDHG